VDLGGIAASVETASATVLIAAENGYTVDELAGMLEGGIPEGVGASYWGSFDASFREFRGVATSDLDVGDFRSLDVEGAEFAAVELRSPAGASEVVARRVDGRWLVDMVATFGPALIRRLRATLDAAVDDPRSAPVRAAFVRAVIPALRAAVELSPRDPLLLSELGAMDKLAGGQ
jgi:hypothetical protein